MDTSLATLLNLYNFPGGRRQVALRQVAEEARGRGLEPLAKHCAGAVEHEKELRNQRRTLITQGRQKTSPKLVALDPIIDRTVGAIYRIASEATTTLTDPALAKAGEAIVVQAMPGGAVAITSKNYPEQTSEIGSVLELLEGDLASPVKALGLTSYVTQLRALNTEFGSELDTKKPEQLTSDDVRASAARGQEHLLQAAAMIVGLFPGDSAEDRAARQDLLGPILAQNEAIRAYLRSRRAVRDVDPDTGAETHDDEQPSPAEPVVVTPAAPATPANPATN